MADSFPQTHTTTTRSTVTTSVSPAVHLNELRSFQGILKIVQIVLSLITFICAASSWCRDHSNVGWGSFVSITGFLIAIAFLICLVMHVRQQVSQMPCVLIELIIYAIWTFFFFVAGATMAATASYYWWCRGATGAGSFFAFATMIVFGIDTFLIFREWKNQSSLPTNRPNQPTTVIHP